MWNPLPPRLIFVPTTLSSLLLPPPTLQVQTIAIFEIVVAAPIGALLIGLLGPRLLTKSGPDLREEERNQKTEEEIEEEQWIADHPDEVVRMGGAGAGGGARVRRSI